MSETRVLIVEDDLRMQKLLQSQLNARGFDARVVETGEEALIAAADDEPDLILLDIALPGMDGLETCRQIREWSTVPIILVTTTSSAQTKVESLEMGADDYITKPFHMGELTARIRAVLRRAKTIEPEGAVIREGELMIDTAQRVVTRAGDEIRLTKIEFNLLKELARFGDRVLTYQHLLEAVWGAGYEDVRAVHVHICNLRRKIEPTPTSLRFIVSVPGVGYRFRRSGE